MALPQGINFRQSDIFVTDGANEYGEVAAAAPDYPVTTPQGNNVGWEYTGATTSRDRQAGNDRRLAGVHSPGTAKDFRIDLPSAGSYNVRIAAGDGNYSCSPTTELIDTAASLGTLATGSTGAGNSFRDATNTIYTAANWPANNTAVNKTFTTTICRFRQTAQIAHVYIEAAASTAQWSGLVVTWNG